MVYVCVVFCINKVMFYGFLNNIIFTGFLNN